MTQTQKIFDSAGNQILPGDIVECPDVPIDYAERYHAAYDDGLGIEIRDLANNNLGIHKVYGRYFTIGHYSKHLDKLTDNDLEYYWNTTRKEAEEIKELMADDSKR